MQETEEKTNTQQEQFESDQNLLGLFAILLAVDKRLYPEKYEFINKEKQND